jgi:hypothetical protein
MAGFSLKLTVKFHGFWIGMTGRVRAGICTTFVVVAALPEGVQKTRVFWTSIDILAL